MIDSWALLLQDWPLAPKDIEEASVRAILAGIIWWLVRKLGQREKQLESERSRYDGLVDLNARMREVQNKAVDLLDRLIEDQQRQHSENQDRLSSLESKTEDLRYDVATIPEKLSTKRGSPKTQN